MSDLPDDLVPRRGAASQLAADVAGIVIGGILLLVTVGLLVAWLVIPHG